MVDHQVGGHERIDLRRVTPQPRHRVTHRRQIDHCRNTGEILHQHARWLECHLALPGAGGRPLRQCDHIVNGGKTITNIAQKRLQKHFD